MPVVSDSETAIVVCGRCVRVSAARGAGGEGSLASLGPRRRRGWLGAEWPSQLTWGLAQLDETTVRKGARQPHGS